MDRTEDTIDSALKVMHYYLRIITVNRNRLNSDEVAYLVAMEIRMSEIVTRLKDLL